MSESAGGLRKRALGEAAEDVEDMIKRKGLRTDDMETDSSDTSSSSSSSSSSTSASLSSDEKTAPEDVTSSADVQTLLSDSAQLHPQADDTWKC